MSTTAPQLSVVVPCFNEAPSLEQLAAEIRAACREANLSFEVWLVDDGSDDETWARIRELHEEDPRFAGVRFRRNHGKSAALAVGFERVRAPYVATIDADLQDDPAEIPEMLEKLRAEELDLVSGWKHDRKDRWTKTLPSRFFNAVTRGVSGISLHDFNCGLKVYKREVVENIQIYGELHRYIPLLAKWEGFSRIGEKPVRHRSRQHGTTKFGSERFIRGFLDLISVVFLTRFAARPMHFFGTLGTLCFLVGFVINAYLTVLKFMGQSLSDRPLLFLGMLLILVGVQLFSTGLIGEMIVRPEMEDVENFAVEETLRPAVREGVDGR